MACWQILRRRVRISRTEVRRSWNQPRAWGESDQFGAESWARMCSYSLSESWSGVGVEGDWGAGLRGLVVCLERKGRKKDILVVSMVL